MTGPHLDLEKLPTPLAGLALGIGSLGWCWENSGLFSGQAQIAGAMVAATLLLLLLLKFVFHPRTLVADLKHPVVGSVVPTFAMASMVVSKAVGGELGNALWLAAVAIHVVFFVNFTWHRLKAFELHHMVPSWFVPPVGIIVADVTSPGGALATLAQLLFWFGLASYALMLPMMIYRFIFAQEVPDAAKPTLAILAAPASLSLAGYLTIETDPSALLVVVLIGVAMLMTAIIYVAFFRLLQLPFSPGYSAFTFPMVIGSTALFKSAAQFDVWGAKAATVSQLLWLARMELIVATVIVGYVSLRYLMAYLATYAAPASSEA
ncbi:Tellurite resistance protein TehA [Cohaesibacter sp. ES.047]|uniref:TDT family transporter n=1 Tax=Cohaesibacter sp. ES.047 TaxID=1798205 RepID=UPI000BB69286|nr:TDT family transporter [Cohaesibacter sp. ES.047]SNY92677.1 Tellurite resistance protein TehA [Cohaesibacter sp. ES.047]